MLGPPKARDLDRPVLISLEAAVLTDHFFRHLHRALDLSFVRDLAVDRHTCGVVVPSIPSSFSGSNA